jgi:hypothetical protein
MPKETWDEAAERAEERMGSGAEEHNLSAGWVSGLTKLAEALHANDCSKQEDGDPDSESTTAAGRMGDTLFLARQGGKKISYDENAIKQGLKVNKIIDCTFTDQISGLPASGIHAEMMIIRYILKQDLIKKHQLVRPKGNILAPDGLQIGTTKGCCLDCAGWLNEKGIPHTPTTGKPSLMWRHPVTLSLYRHYNTKAENEFMNLKFYERVGKKALLQPKDQPKEQFKKGHKK